MRSRLHRSHLLNLFFIGLFSLLVAAPTAAQGGRRFHPADELEEWGHFNLPTPPELSILFSVDMKKIADRAGKLVDPHEYEELKKSWKRLRPRLAELERRYREDPGFRGQTKARYQVTKFRPFREIEPEIRDSEPPFLLVLQRSGDRKKDFTEHEIAHGLEELGY